MSATNPGICTIEELRIAFVHYLKEELPSALECTVEKLPKEEGRSILRTPPYCPELQPIELFWAAGKNHVALQHDSSTKMKDVVHNLREGWYGNGEKYHVGRPLHKNPVNCRKLWSKCLEIAGTKFVNLFDGISGKISSLV